MANRVCIGNRNGTHGLFVSKAGVDVLSASDGDLMFDSRYQAMTVYMRGTLSIPANQRTASVSFSDLGYTPMFDAFRFETHDTNGMSLVSYWLRDATATITRTSLSISIQYTLSYPLNVEYIIYTLG